MTAPIEKLCVFCEHFGWNDVSYYGYGGQTGGGLDGGGLTCAKGMMSVIRFGPVDRHFLAPRPDFDVLPVDTEEFREWIRCAEKCSEYSPPV